MAAEAEPEYRVIGKGAYGVVFKPALPNQGETYPGNVVKIFNHKKDYDQAIQRSVYLREVIGDDMGFRMEPYRQVYTARNLINKKILKQNNIQVPDSTPIYMARMPNLGYSLLDVMRDESKKLQMRKCPLHVMLFNINKLILHLVHMAERELIHGDLHNGNIMYHPETHALTLIDFDWFRPYEKFILTYYSHFGHFGNPPESLLIQGIGLLPNMYVPKKLSMNSPIIEPYLRTVNGSHPTTNHVIQQYARLTMNAYAPYYLVQKLNTEEKVIHFVEESLNINALYLSRRRAELSAEHPEEDPFLISFNIVIRDILPSFDLYSLGMALFATCIRVYPGIGASDENYEQFHHMIQSELRKAGHVYLSEEEWRIASLALHDLGTLLKGMTEPALESRLSPRRALELIEQIHHRFVDAMAAATAEPTPAATAAAVPSHPLVNAMHMVQPFHDSMSHGGRSMRSRKTARRRQHTKRKKTQHARRNHIRR